MMDGFVCTDHPLLVFICIQQNFYKLNVTNLSSFAEYLPMKEHQPKTPYIKM